MRLLLTLSCLAASPALAKILSPQEFSNRNYDYIIVGGGTSGLVVAARLSEIPSIRVGIIEAGEYLPDDERINLPQGSGYLGNPKYDWLFTTVPQENVNDRQIYYARGKMLGGSSAINAMIWQRPSKAEIDFWDTEFQNGPEWNFDALMPYFKKCESWTPPTLLYPGQQQSNSLARSMGMDGPLHISYNTWQADVSTPVVVSGNNLGIFSSSDQFSGNATGFGQIPRTVNPTTGVRSYAANAYYTPNEHRPNLDLVQARVSRILFDEDKTATRVEYLAEDQTFTASVKREVILAAGAVQSPQILELSGVGNKTILTELGIPIVLDLPQVGENLQDHPVSLIDVEVKPGVITLDQLRFNQTYSSEQREIFVGSKSGAFSETAPVLGPTPIQTFVDSITLERMLAELGAFLEQSSLTKIQEVQYRLQQGMLKGGKLGWSEFTMVPMGGLASPAEDGTSYTTVVTIELLPFSRGSTHINSADATAVPSIDPQFLHVPFDAQVLAQGTRFLQKWMATPPMANLVAARHMPDHELPDDDSALKYVRQYLQTTNHALGTTVMAPREMGGVVDPSLKIYGLSNVRVVDAGIIPMITGVATLQLVYAVAEKASDLIKQSLFSEEPSNAQPKFDGGHDQEPMVTVRKTSSEL